jgi:threonine/homoserine/homoserine lactone efflux protein
MSIELYLTFIAASAILIIVPGPNVALIVADGLSYGAKSALTTVAGTSTAIALQLAITCAGMLPLIWLLADWFEWLRWLGVAYLVYLSIQAFRSKAIDLSAATAAPSNKKLFWRGFFVSLTNPKTMLFYAAFFPQFIDPKGDTLAQLMVMCATFLVLAILLDGSYGALAGRSRRLFANPVFSKWRNRVSGSFLLAAALGLGLARRS